MKGFPNKKSHVRNVELAIFSPITDERSTVTSSRSMRNVKMFPTSQYVLSWLQDVQSNMCLPQANTDSHKEKTQYTYESMTSQLYFVPQATHPMSM